MSVSRAIESSHAARPHGPLLVGGVRRRREQQAHVEAAAQGVRDGLHRGDCRVTVALLETAHAGLVHTRQARDLDLREAGLGTGVGEGLAHLAH